MADYRYSNNHAFKKRCPVFADFLFLLLLLLKPNISCINQNFKNLSSTESSITLMNYFAFSPTEYQWQGCVFQKLNDDGEDSSTWQEIFLKINQLKFHFYDANTVSSSKNVIR